MWCCEADYADGTSVKRYFPYDERDIYRRESDRQYDLECWLIGLHPDIVWWSVYYTEVYDDE